MPLQVNLPVLHEDQVRAMRIPGRRKAVRCGRRWGKSALGATIACDEAIKGKLVGYFTPAYKFQTEIFAEISDILSPITRSTNKTEGNIRTITGGVVDFWTLENERAGRSRRYHTVIIDEAAFGKDNTIDIWERSIEPTLLDFSGVAWVLSNTNGDNPQNFFWKVCKEKKLGFKEYHAPSWNNPFVPLPQPGEVHDAWLARRAVEFRELQAKKHPLVFRQEYEAEFVDFSGVAFFSLDKLLEDGKPVQFPTWCESVGLIIDTAVKGGKEHDGTAALWYAFTDPSRHPKHPLVILDWAIVQIDGALMENLLPRWLEHGVELAKECRATYGFRGAFIEDAAAGAILLQQGLSRNWPVEALPSVLTSAGKDARAINASGPVHRGEVKISERAMRKDATFKDTTMNHFVSQVTGFRIGDKMAATRADDLLDCFVYMIAVSLGDQEGYA